MLRKCHLNSFGIEILHHPYLNFVISHTQTTLKLIKDNFKERKRGVWKEDFTGKEQADELSFYNMKLQHLKY